HVPELRRCRVPRIMRREPDAFPELDPGLFDDAVPGPPAEIRVTRRVTTRLVREEGILVGQAVERLAEAEVLGHVLRDLEAPCRRLGLDALDHLAALRELAADVDEVERLLLAALVDPRLDFEIKTLRSARLGEARAVPDHELDLVAVGAARRLAPVEVVCGRDELLDFLGRGLVVLAVRVA